MTKNKFAKILVCCAVIGVVITCGILYFTKYRDFQKSLDDDFDDFEDELEGTENADLSQKDNRETSENRTAPSLKREYVSIPYEPQQSAPLQ